MNSFGFMAGSRSPESKILRYEVCKHGNAHLLSLVLRHLNSYVMTNPC